MNSKCADKTHLPDMLREQLLQEMLKYFVDFAQDSPSLDFNEDQTLSWIAVMTAKANELLRNTQRLDVNAYVKQSANILVFECHAASQKAGWWTDLHMGESLIGKRNVGEALMLIVSEIAEAMEGHRKGLQDDHLPNRPMIEVELADAIIRICDLAGALGLDLGGAMAEKMAYNAQRADHKPEARKSVGGKSY